MLKNLQNSSSPGSPLKEADGPCVDLLGGGLVSGRKLLGCNRSSKGGWEGVENVLLGVVFVKFNLFMISTMASFPFKIHANWQHVLCFDTSRTGIKH